MPTVRSLNWEDVRPIAQEAFSIWTGQPELSWAETAWSYITEAGLAPDGSSLDRLTAYIRFFALASIYRDWCATVWEEKHDDAAYEWLGTIDDATPIQVGQLLTADVDLDSDDSDDALEEALNRLIARERDAVVDALLRGFGGAAGLFVSLWKSNLDAEERDAEGDAEILNDPTEEKLAGYAWIEEGCPSIGPIRALGDFD